MSIAVGNAVSPVFQNFGSGGGSAPAAPTNLVATVNGLNIDLTWTDNATDEDGYKIYRSPDNVVFSEIDDIAAGSTSYTDVNPGAGVWYYYVAAYNVAGESDSNVANAFIGALDGVPNLVHLYDIARRWVSSYSGPLVRIARLLPTPAEMDFTYVANGDLDVAAIATFLSGNSGFIRTIYDQVGSENVTQATTSAQPLYVASGQNGKPVSRYNGTSHNLTVTFSSSLSQPFSVYAAAKSSDASGIRRIMDGIDGANRIIAYQGINDWRAYAGANLISAPNDTNWNIWAILAAGVGGQFWLNGTSKATGDIGAHNPAGIRIGAVVGGGNFWLGDISTVIIADPSHSTAQRQTVENAINAYYNIF